jgi:hypothetical protein
MNPASVSEIQAGSFVWSDAWVLASVAVGGGLKGCQLKDIIAAGDLINRAIIDASELRSALGKLIAKGYVERIGGLFVIAGEVRFAVEQLLAQRAESFGVMQFFEEFLEVDAYSANDGDIAEAGHSLGDLSDLQVKAAASAYREELAALWRELRQIDQYSLPERALRLLDGASRARRK